MVKGLKVRNDEEIILEGVKTAEKMIAEGVDPAPILKQVRFVTEKVSKKVFNCEAMSGYDETIRETGQIV